MDVFARTPGTRPAALAGLINGVAIGTPLLVGVAAGSPAAGAAACVGAYVAAFTNKGGPRGPRTIGLLVSATLNTVMFAAGGLSAPWFPLNLALLAALVFVASMGTTFGATVSRCGTMPATAFLAGMTAHAVHSLGAAVALVAAGGLWYAVATMLLTPAPHLRQVRADIAVLYRELAAGVAGRAADPAFALKQAETAVLVLAGPGGDDALAHDGRRLVSTAAGLIDSIAALDAVGPPDPVIAPEYLLLRDALSARLEAVAGMVTGGSPSVPGTELADYVAAVERLRARVVEGSASYARLADAAQLRRRFRAVDTAVDTAMSQANRFGRYRNVRVPSAAVADAVTVTPRRVRDALSLTSSIYRHALRTTLIASVLFAVVVLTSLPHGEWAVLAAVRVLRPQYGETAQRVSQRVVGNVVGGTAAALAIEWVDSPAVLAVAVFVIISVGFALRPMNYAFWVLFGTPLILLIGDLTDPGDWHAALGRIVMTLVGTAVALVGSFLILPVWDSSRLPGLRDKAVSATADYLDAVLAHVAEPGPDTDDVRQSTRHNAEAALAKAIETLHHAQREPGRHETQSVETILGHLGVLQAQLAVLAGLPAARSVPIPGLAEFRSQAMAALKVGVDAGALEATVDGLRAYLRDLHTRRAAELVSGPDVDSPARTAIRENQPVVAQLIRIAETITSLAA